jgi:signal transduction histidine kinase
MPRPARWPWVLLAVFVTVALVGLIAVVANGESIAAQIPFIVAFSVFGVVGALIASRDRANVIGLLLLEASVVTACSFVAGEYFTWRVASGHEGADVVVAGFVNNFGWLFGILPFLFFLPLLFPDGHLPSRRWRWFVWSVVALLVLVSVGFVFGQATLTGSSETLSVPNPFYLDAVGGLPSLDPLIAVLFPSLFALSILSLFLRFRRSSGVVRQQIKWVIFGLLIALVGILAGYVITDPVLNSLLTGAAFLAFPTSIGIAVLRYRLYDLDVVVKKALVAGTLALLVILVYGGVVYLLGRITTARESSGWVFVVALVLGLAFRPVARSARRLADRVVYGRRATPYEVLTEFAERVGGSYATQDVLGRMAAILAGGVGARTARVWLHVGDELRPAASWPPAAIRAEAVRVSADALPGIGGETVVEVRDAGELLGALSVAMPASDPMTPAKERLVRDLASQAGLVLRNVRLVEELRASQRRIVAAQDQERRRLERDIHDGAQQQLVALTVKMRLARSLASRDAAKTQEMLEQMQEETQAALEDLRDLARGIYPPLLADQGLAAALDAQARKSPIPVQVSPNGVGRYPQEVEAAVYFACLEALQNVAKHASPTRAEVRLGESDGALVFEVADDGDGFDPSANGYGTGLQGMVDRLRALDGTLEIRSARGQGTTVIGQVPLGEGRR